MEEKEKKKNVHSGHRKRVKEEFLARGLEGWADHRVLELILYFAIPQGDVNPLAHDLIDQFGSLAGVLNAPHEQLTAVKGVGDNTATLLRLITAAGGRYLKSQSSRLEVLEEPWQFQELLAPCFFGAASEMAYLICLDPKNKLISCKKISEGDPLGTDVSARRVVSSALACNAVTVVLAHNHVSGVARPSGEDLAATRYLHKLLREVGVELHDHYIVTEESMLSMRAGGFFDQLER